MIAFLPQWSVQKKKQYLIKLHKKNAKFMVANFSAI